VKRVLAIRFARLGDVILLLPALSTIKKSLPDAHLTLLTGHRCAAAAEMCPAVDEVISVDRIAMRDGPVWRALHDVKKLVSDIRSRQFDAVIDFHSFRETNLLAWFSRSPFRVGMRRQGASYLGFCFNQPPVDEDKSIHVAEMFLRLATALPGVRPAPLAAGYLEVPEPARRWAAENLPQQPAIALYVDAPVADRRWPAESFAAVADFASERLAARPIVMLGSTGPELRDRVVRCSRYPDRLTVLEDISVPQVAAAIERCRVLLSNDTGPMHLGPALNIPTLGLFSVGIPQHFRPIGAGDLFLKGNPIEEIPAGRVIRELERMWSMADPGLPR
jgi:ADP-heptose:LPS heptosyltransferase